MYSLPYFYTVQEPRNYITNILLAEDDEDDRAFFAEALTDINPNIELSHAHDGNQLLDLLNGGLNLLPEAVFLDLNMPLKNGFESLKEIRANAALDKVAVIILSTSWHQATIDTVYTLGANMYIIKPNSFHRLKDVIEKVLTTHLADIVPQPPKENFVLSS